MTFDPTTALHDLMTEYINCREDHAGEERKSADCIDLITQETDKAWAAVKARDKDAYRRCWVRIGALSVIALEALEGDGKLETEHPIPNYEPRNLDQPGDR